MRRCRGQCKGPHSTEFVIETVYDVRGDPRVVVHDPQRCLDEAVLLKDRLRAIRRT